MDTDTQHSTDYVRRSKLELTIKVKLVPAKQALDCRGCVLRKAHHDACPAGPKGLLCESDEFSQILVFDDDERN